MPRNQKVASATAGERFPIAGDNLGRIILGLMTDMTNPVLTALSAHLGKVFGVPVEPITMNRDVSYAFSRIRNQYSSPRILAKLRKLNKKPDKILGIVDVDLFCPDYDFVFGEADAAAGAATLSIYRLHQDTSDSKLITSRIIKEATHEVGHLFNLGHCEDPDCVMSFSVGNLSQVDSKSASVCPVCHSPAGLSALKTIPD
jgi:archaemetzincin